MKSLKLRLQLTLTRMRQKQRTEQKALEKELATKEAATSDNDVAKKDEENGDAGDADTQVPPPVKKPAPPIYCKTCKLVFHTKRTDHNQSEMHKLIGKFLSPRCLICNTQYYSPMAYEKHLATVQHLKVIYFQVLIILHLI